MGYYQDRKQALIDIENIIRRSKEIGIVNLIDYVDRRYGFGEGYVRNILARMTEMGKIKISEGVIHLVDHHTPKASEGSESSEASEASQTTQTTQTTQPEPQDKPLTEEEVDKILGV